MFENSGLFDSPTPRQVELVRRRKTKGPAQHYGVRVWWSPFEVHVYDFQFTSEVRQLTEDEFAEGLPVETIWAITDHAQVSASWDRMCQILGGKWRYDPLKQNCEHVARYIVFGKVESPQVAGGWLIAGGLAVAFLLMRE